LGTIVPLLIENSCASLCRASFAGQARSMGKTLPASALMLHNPNVRHRRDATCWRVPAHRGTNWKYRGQKHQVFLEPLSISGAAVRR